MNLLVFFFIRFSKDMITCGSPSSDSKAEHIMCTKKFFDLVHIVKEKNKSIHQFDCLFFLIECDPRIEDEFDHIKPQDISSQDISLCTGDSRPLDEVDQKRVFVCNWPVSSQTSNLKSLSKEDVTLDGDDSNEENCAFHEKWLGFPRTYCKKSVSKLYLTLRSALFAFLSNSKWRDIIHPKFWTFLSLGPLGYHIKLKEDPDFGVEAFLILLRHPVTLHALSDTNYAMHLLTQSESARWLFFLLRPLKDLFNERSYGACWDSPYSEDSMCSAPDSAEEESNDAHVEDASTIGVAQASPVSFPISDGGTENGDANNHHSGEASKYVANEHSEIQETCHVEEESDDASIEDSSDIGLAQASAVLLPISDGGTKNSNANDHYSEEASKHMTNEHDQNQEAGYVKEESNDANVENASGIGVAQASAVSFPISDGDTENVHANDHHSGEDLTTNEHCQNQETGLLIEEHVEHHNVGGPCVKKCEEAYIDSTDDEQRESQLFDEVEGILRNIDTL